MTSEYPGYKAVIVRQRTRGDLTYEISRRENRIELAIKHEGRTTYDKWYDCNPFFIPEWIIKRMIKKADKKANAVIDTYLKSND